MVAKKESLKCLLRYVLGVVTGFPILRLAEKDALIAQAAVPLVRCLE